MPGVSEVGGKASLPAGLTEGLSAFSGVPVLVVGDVMLDHYLSGDAERISPESPVPVVHVTQERHMMGGAGNVARNLKALGGKTTLLSVIGDDGPGAAMRDLLAQEGIEGHLVVERKRQTTIKTRIIARNQQMLRVDREESTPVSGKSLEAFHSVLSELMPSHGVVIVSDYGKGVVGTGLMDMLRSFRKGSDGPLILVDPKVVNAGLYAGVDLLTPNAKEAGEIAGFKASGRDQVIKAGLAIFKKLRCKQLCVTLGPDGMAVFERPGRVLHVPTVARNVFDVTGAGDTVISVLALGMAAGLGLARSSVLANYAAGIVVGQVGTAVATQGEILSAMEQLEPPVMESWLDIE